MTHILADEARGWRAYADTLADLSLTRLVNRTDVWGEYIPLVHRHDPNRKSYTAPKLQDRGMVSLTRDTLARHYRGERTMGLHATGPENTSRWLGFDLDAHGDTGAGVQAENFARVARIVAALRESGCSPVVEASCDRGGMHVWTLFDAPAPTGDVFAFARAILDAAETTNVETFPKQAHLAPGQFGNWLRLPGRHHSRPWWSWIADGTRWWKGADAARAWGDAPLTMARVVPPAPEGTPCIASQPPLVRLHAHLAPLAVPGARTGRRVLAYAERLGYGLCDGRKTAAYRFACFLMYEAALAEGAAWRYCVTWNSFNVPPLDEGVLAGIVRNARRYGGRRAVVVA